VGKVNNGLSQIGELIHQGQHFTSTSAIDAQEMVEHRRSNAIAIAGVHCLTEDHPAKSPPAEGGVGGAAGGCLPRLLKDLVHELFAHLTMGRELAANQGNQVFCPFFGVVWRMWSRVMLPAFLPSA
jgi:hypothetical protein